MIAQNKKNVKYLGVDYGQKHIGLAKADKQIKIAHPYLVLENQGRDFVLDELKKIMAKENIIRIIVGRPIGLSGRKTEQTKITDEFIEFLADNSKVPVESFDERFTSKMSGGEHSGAAAIILQDYLDRSL